MHNPLIGTISPYLAVATLVLMPGLAWLEYKNLSILRYSKFGGRGGLGSKWGMLIIYVFALPGVCIGAWSYLQSPRMVQLVLLGAILFHFAKRCVEVLLLHRYSGEMEWLTALSISAFYTGFAFVAGLAHRITIPAADIWFFLGLALFAAGQIINLYHHWLLAALRGKTKEYRIPTGGLFGLVSCPHYLGEIIAWVGFACMSRHVWVLIMIYGMFWYLLGRSLRTTQWYRQTFADYPRARRSLIPFVI